MSTTWWGRYELPSGMAGRWSLGPPRLWVSRRDHEWRVATLREGDPLSPLVEIALPIPPPDLPPGAAITRFAFARTSPGLTLAPLLADRPVVATPEVPFQVLPGETARAYVSTPLWCVLQVDPGPRTLVELPSSRPSDTWFGPPTAPSGLSYASRTRLRLDQQNLAWVPHRAVTPVVIRNDAGDPVLVERIRLPVPNLALYAARSGALWTPRVTLENDTSRLVVVKVEREPPPEATSAALLARARVEAPSSGILSTFQALLHL